MTINKNVCDTTLVRLLHHDLLTGPPAQPQWIVQDLLDRGTIVLLAGEAGAGKSFLAYQLAYCVTTGLPFLGFPTTPTRVLYFDEENATPHIQRYCQWIWHGLGRPDVMALDECFHIHSLSLKDNWRATMSQLAAACLPGLIIVDTATPAFHIEDENSNAEATLVIAGLHAVQRAAANNTTILVLKHERQRDDVTHRRTVRGAKAWEGASDAILFQARRPGKPRRDGWTTTRLEPGKLRAFGLRSTINVTPTKVGAEGYILEGNIAHPPEATKPTD